MSSSKSTRPKPTQTAPPKLNFKYCSLLGTFSTQTITKIQLKFMYKNFKCKHSYWVVRTNGDLRECLTFWETVSLVTFPITIYKFRLIPTFQYIVLLVFLYLAILSSASSCCEIFMIFLNTNIATFIRVCSNIFSHTEHCPSLFQWNCLKVSIKSIGYMYKEVLTDY